MKGTCPTLSCHASEGRGRKLEQVPCPLLLLDHDPSIAILYPSQPFLAPLAVQWCDGDIGKAVSSACQGQGRRVEGQLLHRPPQGGLHGCFWLDFKAHIYIH